jgi:hypothetical protein
MPPHIVGRVPAGAERGSAADHQGPDARPVVAGDIGSAPHAQSARSRRRIRAGAEPSWRGLPSARAWSAALRSQDPIVAPGPPAVPCGTSGGNRRASSARASRGLSPVTWSHSEPRATTCGAAPGQGPSHWPQVPPGLQHHPSAPRAPATWGTWCPARKVTDQVDGASPGERTPRSLRHRPADRVQDQTEPAPGPGRFRQHLVGPNRRRTAARCGEPTRTVTRRPLAPPAGRRTAPLPRRHR